MRKVTLQTTATLKINVGNYETVDVSKTVTADIEFEKPEELVDRSSKHDTMVGALLKAEAEGLLEQLGRKRIMKIGGQDTPADLWKSYVQSAAGTRSV